MIDLLLAKYKYDRQLPAKSHYFDGNPVLKRQTVLTSKKHTGQYDELLKRIRDSAYLRHEGHVKQSAYMQNKLEVLKKNTWQIEYDRLQSQSVPEALQPFVNARLSELKVALVK